MTQSSALSMGTETGFAVFDCAIGRCALAWSARGVAGLAFPEASEERTRARLLRRLPGLEERAPPAPVAQAIERIAGLMEGDRDDLRDIALDLEAADPFERRVYDIARSIPPGETMTYGEIAARLGDPSAARAVGQAMGANPIPIIVPCHRVVGAGGKAGGFSAPGGLATKARLLSIERARIGAERLLFEDLPVSIRADRRRRT